eukprot:3060-Hanusia_phi.AAC.2
MAIGDMLEDGAKVEMFKFENQTKQRVLISLFESQTALVKESAFVECGGTSPVMDSRPGDQICVADPSGTMLFTHGGKATEGEESELARACTRMLNALTETESFLSLIPYMLDHASDCLEECEVVEEALALGCTKASDVDDGEMVVAAMYAGEQQKDEDGWAETQSMLEHDLEMFGDDVAEVGRLLSEMSPMYEVIEEMENDTRELSVDDIICYNEAHGTKLARSTSSSSCCNFHHDIDVVTLLHPPCQVREANTSLPQYLQQSPIMSDLPPTTSTQSASGSSYASRKL